MQSTWTCRPLNFPLIADLGRANHPSGSFNGPGGRALVSYASLLFKENGDGFKTGT